MATHHVMTVTMELPLNFHRTQGVYLLFVGLSGGDDSAGAHLNSGTCQAEMRVFSKYA